MKSLCILFVALFLCSCAGIEGKPNADAFAGARLHESDHAISR
jgi:hypothetical protein